MRGGLNTKMLPPFGTESLMDGEGREGGKSDLEGQRLRVEAGERKMSSVASTPFFMELLPPLDTNIKALHMETDTVFLTLL